MPFLGLMAHHGLLRLKALTDPSPVQPNPCFCALLCFCVQGSVPPSCVYVCTTSENIQPMIAYSPRFVLVTSSMSCYFGVMCVQACFVYRCVVCGVWCAVYAFVYLCLANRQEHKDKVGYLSYTRWVGETGAYLTSLCTAPSQIEFARRYQKQEREHKAGLETRNSKHGTEKKDAL